MISFNYFDFNITPPKIKDSWIKNKNVDFAADFRDYIKAQELLFNYPDKIKFNKKYYEITSDLFIDNEEDGDPVFLSFNKSVWLREGCTLAPRYRCKGLYILVNGDLIVDGTITMKQKGCKGEGRFVGFDVGRYKNSYGICVIHSLTNIFEEKKIKYIDKIGGSGGSKNQSNMGANGGTHYCYGENGNSSLTSSRRWRSRWSILQ